MSYVPAQALVPQLDTALNGTGTCVAGNESATTTLSTPSCVVPAGDFVIITMTAVRNAQTITPSDTVGDTFLLANGTAAGTTSCYQHFDNTESGGTGEVAIFYIASAKGGSPNVFTNTPAASASLEIHVSAWKNMAGWTPDQCITSGATTGGLSYNSGSRTTLFDGELIFGYTFPLGSSSAGSGFTALSFVNGDTDEYQLQSTAGSVSATSTSDSSANWLATMVTFAAPPNPPAPPALAPTLFAENIPLLTTR